VERLRRSMLYIPGSSMKMLEKAKGLEADSLIIDLEDAVALSQKEAARKTVVSALKSLDFGDKERNVRINAISTPFGRDDIKAVVGAKPDGLVIPKVNSAEDVKEVEALVDVAEKECGIDKDKIYLLAMIETPLAIVNIEGIASSSKRLKAMLFGAADYTKETRGKITKERLELIYPLNRMVIAARIAGIDAIDSPYFNVKDEEGLIYHTKIVRNMGYDGKSVIHPAQIKPVNEIFTPTKEDVEFAKKAIEAFKEAEAKGIGATVVDGQLVERLHVETAKRTLTIAQKAGIV